MYASGNLKYNSLSEKDNMELRYGPCVCKTKNSSVV